MKIVFDIETTGLPERKDFSTYYDPSLITYYNNSRLVQIAYIVLDSENKEIKRYSSIILPRDFEIKNDHIHHIPHEKALKEGREIKDVLNIFFEDLKKCKMLIAHNIKFDYNVLMSELYRFKLNDIIKECKNKILYCTMVDSKLKYNFNRYPKLVELFPYLYNGEIWNQIHDALDDADICMKCYIKMNEC